MDIVDLMISARHILRGLLDHRLDPKLLLLKVLSKVDRCSEGGIPLSRLCVVSNVIGEPRCIREASQDKSRKDSLFVHEQLRRKKGGGSTGSV